ncbi:MAG: NAD-dependent epimerase [Cyclobacteriaceae bacterium]|nr:NAD-dependent epimerase [Cyclobacteriaceae bacterium]
MSKILVTGAAGFIGFHLANRLLKDGWEVVGLDNLNDYYDVSLKESRLEILKTFSNFAFEKVNLEDNANIDHIFKSNNFEYVINLAAQAGVRYSLENPHCYVQTNIQGFLNILEGCRNYPVKHLVYASSSSVYGANKKMPLSVNDNVDHPLALYAATKKCNELMAHSYASLYNIASTGLRFFSVYGPWGRPDMALFLFTKSIVDGTPIKVFNNGEMSRDFTYIDDIVEGIYRIIKNPATPNLNWDPEMPDVSSSYAPYRIYNIGHGKPVELNRFIELIEQNLGKKAIRENYPMQPGDIPLNHCDIAALKDAVVYVPEVRVEDGIRSFVSWFRTYYNV